MIIDVFYIRKLYVRWFVCLSAAAWEPANIKTAQK